MQPLSDDTSRTSSIDSQVDEVTLHEHQKSFRALTRLLDERLARLQEAREAEPFTTSQGASNFPSDRSVWVVDWRENLPSEDPQRRLGPPLPLHHATASQASLAAAHRAIRQALRNHYRRTVSGRSYAERD